MNNLNNIQTYYFVGIGGIGMSALARYFKMQGKAVFGYDKTSTDLTEELVAEGIPVTFTDEISEIQKEVRSKENVLVVYTPAVPKGNKILNHFFSEDFHVVKRAELLGEVSKNTLCLAVAGTHGKTTTSAILGHLLAECNMPVTAFLGGIAENYNSNFIYKGSEITVVEADEFDRSFLQLRPDIACVTSMDADHLDIYGDVAEIENAFRTFAQLVKKEENIFIKRDLPLDGKTVAIEETADYEAQNVKIQDSAYVFDLKTPSLILENLTFNLPGRHNLTNAIMALGMAITAGSPIDCLPKALASFKGVKRRFSYKIKTENMVLIDDYAHHPTEIDALFQAVDEMYPNDHKQIVFQPHLFSRTRDFAEGFAKSLSQFDEVILLDIYPAREEPIEGITSEWLLSQVEALHKRVVFKSALPEVLLKSKCRVKLLVGAGDIGAEVNKITQKLKDEA
ncbi:UDP-N-acetylmuramate--L-alanine ligase [Aequorivita sublithincola DSM 14238]|uniref:UDP-N-acetylmuramate--L-alanine ligase n=1 Tax=Aequorivita sublithincola (strain DSM 14238 / LMG 21431 / ACAM 643 / 9-3) TaxID=746697 RepID=I3YWI8_AEQSU|nr:UDP-N-acetylmuramate--L-alanine ligase [Aequorivita sublithincola]AFL81356.1 UDP-N-acetylmuramate--L-alanine ligase [Aequorivita sublithincola DSM 14238]